jgi:hypothetical protein
MRNLGVLGIAHAPGIDAMRIGLALDVLNSNHFHIKHLAC